MKLSQRVLLAKFDRDNMYSIGFAEAGKFALEKRESWTLDDFRKHLQDQEAKLVNPDEYEQGILYSLKLNIKELEGVI